MNSTVHGYATRGSNKLHISYARTDVMRSQLRIAGPRLWNTIDPAIINNSFSNKIIKITFLQCIYEYAIT